MGKYIFANKATHAMSNKYYRAIDLTFIDMILELDS
jgi:hypothetical protein